MKCLAAILTRRILDTRIHIGVDTARILTSAVLLSGCLPVASCASLRSTPLAQMLVRHAAQEVDLGFLSTKNRQWYNAKICETGVDLSAILALGIKGYHINALS